MHLHTSYWLSLINTQHISVEHIYPPTYGCQRNGAIFDTVQNYCWVSNNAFGQPSTNVRNTDQKRVHLCPQNLYKDRILYKRRTLLWITEMQNCQKSNSITSRIHLWVQWHSSQCAWKISMFTPDCVWRLWLQPKRTAPSKQASVKLLYVSGIPNVHRHTAFFLSHFCFLHNWHCMVSCRHISTEFSVWKAHSNKIFLNPSITSSACKVYAWKPAVQKHTAAQNQLYSSAALHFTTYQIETVVSSQPLIQLYSATDQFKDNWRQNQTGLFIWISLILM